MTNPLAPNILQSTGRLNSWCCYEKSLVCSANTQKALRCLRHWLYSFGSATTAWLNTLRHWLVRAVITRSAFPRWKHDSPLLRAHSYCSLLQTPGGISELSYKSGIQCKYIFIQNSSRQEKPYLRNFNDSSILPYR